MFEDEAQAQDALDEFASGMGGADAEGCVSDLLGEALEQEDQDPELGEIDVGELGLTARDVDEASAWQLVIPVEITSGAADGLSATVYLDLVHLREGDTIATLETVDVLSQFGPELRDELLGITAGLV